MAGGCFARAARSGKSGVKFLSSSRYANTSRSKATTSLQRKVTTSSRTQKFSLLALSAQNNFNNSFASKTSFAFPPPCSLSLLSTVKACGLHTTAGTSVESDGSGESGSSIGEATNSDSAIDPLAVNFPPGTDDGGGGSIQAAQDIFSSGLPVDVPLSEIGLGGYTPVGLIQHALDFLHVGIGLPWWCSIVVGTVLFRAIVFPIMIKGQVNSAKLAAVKPELERLQQNLRDMSNYHNPMMKAQASIELQELFKKHDCHPAKALISPLVQLPLFVSFFLALRKMSYLPVESMKTGGALWFTDLTAADPYYALPVICAATMLLTIETGADAGMSANTDQMSTMKNVFRGMCLIMVPLTYHFPTAIFTYWLTSNVLSLVQVGVMKVPGFKTYLGIPETIPTPATDPSIKPGSFMENLRAGYKAAAEAAHVQHAEKMKEKQYKDSLKSTYQETFDYNPKRTRQNEELFSSSKVKLDKMKQK